MRGVATLPSTVDGSVGGYIAQIRRVPMLEVQEEQALAKRWRERGDRAAADRLVTSHLRLVAKIAWGFRGYGCRCPTSSPRGASECSRR
jgi:RNA polymerase sigma-32 factor